jgi:hypothetical protein
MQILLPSKNLGCLGIRLTKKVYFDFFRSPYWGMFIRVGPRAWRVSRRGVKSQYIG